MDTFRKARLMSTNFVINNVVIILDGWEGQEEQKIELKLPQGRKSSMAEPPKKLADIAP